MKYLCLGYLEDGAWDALSERQRESLRQDRTPTTLRRVGDRVLVVEGTANHAAERLGGAVLLDAADLNDAIRLASQLPWMRAGGYVEIRPIENVFELERPS